MDLVQLLWTTDRAGSLSAEWGGCRATVLRLVPGFEAVFVVSRLGEPPTVLTSGTLLSTHAAMLAATNALAQLVGLNHSVPFEAGSRVRAVEPEELRPLAHAFRDDEAAAVYV